MRGFNAQSLICVVVLSVLSSLTIILLNKRDSRPQGYKTFFPGSTQLSTKIILLINVKMPIIVGIYTFISIINATSERLKARNFFICRCFSFMSR